MTDPHHPRGRRSYDERRREFTLLRDKILLAVGAVGLLGVTVAAVTIGIKDVAVALAAVTLFGALLGAPTALRLDEARERRRDEP